MPTHFQCLSGSNSAIRKAVFNPFESRNVPRLSEHNGPGGDFTTDRMCFAQLGHFSTLAKWSQVNANGARTVKTLSTILFMGGNRSEDFDYSSASVKIKSCGQSCLSPCCRRAVAIWAQCRVPCRRT